MAPITRKSLIIDRYSILELELRQYVDKAIFPSLEDVDVADLAYILTYLFLGINTDEQYRDKIFELIQEHDVAVDLVYLDIVIERITDFIKWFKEI